MKLYFKYTSIAFVIIVIVFTALYLIYDSQSLPAMGDIDTPEITDTDAPDTTDTASEPSETEPSETEPPITEPPEAEPQTPKKRVAFTFDDGPAYDNADFQRLTYKLVDKFAEYGGEATFFLVGNRISKTTGEAIKYASEKGCEIGIHAYTHEYDFSKCDYSIFIDELATTKAAIEKYSSKTVTLFRPPYGSITSSRAADSGYPVILWNVDSEDWRYKSRADEAPAQQNIQTIVDNILSQVEDGDIILMHEIYRNSYEATCIAVDALAAKGYEFVTVSELLGEENLKAGKTYYNGKPIG